MKKILSLLWLTLLFAGAANAQEPRYGVQSILNDIVITASTATNVGLVIDTRKQATVTLQIDTTNTLNSAVADGTINILYSQSVDGVRYWTNLQTVAIVPRGLQWNTVVTNLSSFGAGYIKIHYITNACGGATNVGTMKLQYAVKINSP